MLEMMKHKYASDNGLNHFFDDPKGFMTYVHDSIIKPLGRYTFEELFERVAGEPFSLKFL